MTDEIAQEAAQAPTTPEDAESSQATPTSEAVAAEPDSPPDADPESESQKPRAQERIEQVIAERNAAKEYGEYWRQEALRQQAPATAPAEPAPQPTMEQFDFDQDKWASAYSSWANEQATSAATKAVKTQLGVQAEATRKADLQSKWNERAADFAETHPDYHAVVTNPTIQLTEGMIEAMAESEKGPNIAYKLSQDPAKAARIARMSPIQQAAAIGRLEAEVSKPKPQPTTAPEPPNPVGGQQPGASPADMDIDEWMENRVAERREKGLR